VERFKILFAVLTPIRAVLSSHFQSDLVLCDDLFKSKLLENVVQGAGRVAFSNQQSYIAAISARFVQLQHGEIDKRVSPPLPLLSC
jgi:hypothetical protein